MARNASPLTVTIREILEKNKGAITFSEALPLIQKLDPSYEGSKGDINHFNVTKSNWKKGTSPTVSEKPSKNVAKNSKVVKVVKVAKNASKIGADQYSAVRKLVELGGMKVVQKRMVQLHAELETLQTLVDSTMTVQKALVA